ncbi:hypothetical protein Pa4123_91500 [Phytohabitans aurantiacus]|uniref:Tetracyclin repressor-like C-terminal group 31 domain-containing protein n=2 Tax=Phytohabitans aurantiacus TaxID=3016789 RepID=A0ABQ5RB42_9ACTN|nr:hypothetical protein Pa4123_91500 [Phytohabitans aurantiacus]
MGRLCVAFQFGRTSCIDRMPAGRATMAARQHRSRYLAIFELRLEGLRRPALAAAIDELMVAYGGALFVLATGQRRP